MTPGATVPSGLVCHGRTSSVASVFYWFAQIGSLRKILADRSIEVGSSNPCWLPASRPFHFNPVHFRDFLNLPEIVGGVRQSG